MLQFTENRQRNIGLSASSNPRTVLNSVGLLEASLAEAQAGTVQNRYMSPLRVAQTMAGIADGDLTRVSDTNVTLTLGGTPTNALFEDVSITVGWSGTLAAARGGWGADISGSSGIPVITAGVAAFFSPGSGVQTFLTTPSSANLLAAVTDETGSGALVFANTPTLVTPILGTPTSGTLTNCTGLPVSTGISGLGTGIATALGVNVGSAGAPVLFNGAGGTPSALTLTNATGLPLSSGVTGDLPFANLTQGDALSVLGVTGNSTADVASIAAGSDHQVFRRSGTAVAFGSVDLSQAGAVGTSVLPLANGGTNAASASAARTSLGVAYGKQSIWIPAAAMTPRTTNGAALGLVEMTTNKNMVRTLDFDTSTQEFAQFEIRMPKSWDESTVTFVPVWSHAATVTNFGVVWALQAIAISNDDTLDVAFGTEQTSTDTGGTTNDSYQGPESSAITVGGTPAEGDCVMFQIKRNVADGSDTLAVDARLHGLLVLYTNNTSNDT